MMFRISVRRKKPHKWVFTDITYYKRINHFSLRTQEKVNIQWLFYTVYIFKNINPEVPLGTVIFAVLFYIIFIDFDFSKTKFPCFAF